MSSTISKLTLFISLQRNVYLLSSISIALFAMSAGAIKLAEGKILCKIGAIFISILSIFNILAANNYLKKKNNTILLKHLKRSVKIYTLLLTLLCFVFLYSIIKHDLLQN